MKKTLIVTLSIVVLIISSFAFTLNDPPGYKNLKILPKDISKEKLDSIMHHFSLSLHVRCTFCHVRNESEKKWDFASDSVADKLIARKMMLMTMDINKNYFKPDEEDKRTSEMVQSVTCFTCHRGSELPLTIPPMPPPRTEGLQQQKLKPDTTK